MALPRRLAVWNRRYTDPLFRALARRRRGFALVSHVGRRSGRAYSTALQVFPAGDRVLVVLTYGPSADWFRNVAVGGGRLETAEGSQDIAALRLVDRTVAWPRLSRRVRLALRLFGVRDFAELVLAAPDPPTCDESTTT